MTRGALLFCLLGVASAAAQVHLSEVMADPATDEHHDEFVELWNAGPDTVDLASWSLGDADELDGIVDAGEGTRLAPGEAALVLDGSYDGASTAYESVRGSVRILTIEDRAFGRSGWSNGVPEEVRLVDPSGHVHDRMRYDPADGRPGHSWERRHADSTWHLSWRSGGTPGRPNSIDQTPAPTGQIDLDVSPDPFVEVLRIHCVLPAAPALLSVGIYDADGRRVARLRDWDAAGLEEVITWDGHDDDARRCPPGLYVVSVRSSAGGRIVSARSVVARQ